MDDTPTPMETEIASPRVELQVSEVAAPIEKEQADVLELNPKVMLDHSLKAIVEKYRSAIPRPMSPISRPRSRSEKRGAKSNLSIDEEEVLHKHRIQIVSATLEAYVKVATDELVQMANAWIHKETVLLGLLQRKDAQMMTALHRERVQVSKLRDGMRAYKAKLQNQQEELQFLLEQYKLIEASYDHIATHCKLTYADSGAMADFNRTRNSFEKQLEYLTKRVDDTAVMASLNMSPEALEGLAAEMQLYQTPEIMRQRITFLESKSKQMQLRIDQLEAEAQERQDADGHRQSLEQAYEERHRQVVLAEKHRIDVLVLKTRKRALPVLWQLKADIVCLKDIVLAESFKMTQVMDQALHGAAVLVTRSDFGSDAGGVPDKSKMIAHRNMMLALKEQVDKLLQSVGKEMPKRLLQLSLGTQFEGFSWERMGILVTGLMEQLQRLEDLPNQLEQLRDKQRQMQEKVDGASGREEQLMAKQRALAEANKAQGMQIQALTKVVAEKEERIQQLIHEDKSKEYEELLESKEKAIQAIRSDLAMAQKRYRDSMTLMEDMKLKVIKSEKLAAQQVEEERNLRIQMANESSGPANNDRISFHDMIVKKVGPLLSEASSHVGLQNEIEAMASFGKLMDSTMGLFERIDDPEDEVTASQVKRETRQMIQSWISTVMPVVELEKRSSAYIEGSGDDSDEEISQYAAPGEPQASPTHESKRRKSARSTGRRSRPGSGQSGRMSPSGRQPVSPSGRGRRSQHRPRSVVYEEEDVVDGSADDIVQHAAASVTPLSPLSPFSPVRPKIKAGITRSASGYKRHTTSPPTQQNAMALEPSFPVEPIGANFPSFPPNTDLKDYPWETTTDGILDPKVEYYGTGRHGLANPLALEVLVPGDPAEMKVRRRATGDEIVEAYRELRMDEFEAGDSSCKQDFIDGLSPKDAYAICPKCGTEMKVSRGISSPYAIRQWAEQMRAYQLQRQMLMQKAMHLWNRVITRYGPFCSSTPVRTAKPKAPLQTPETPATPVEKPLLLGSRTAAVASPLHYVRHASKSLPATMSVVPPNRTPTVYDVLAESHRFIPRDLHPVLWSTVPPSLPPCQPDISPPFARSLSSPPATDCNSLPQLGSVATAPRPRTTSIAERNISRRKSSKSANEFLEVRPLSNMKVLEIADGPYGRISRSMLSESFPSGADITSPASAPASLRTSDSTPKVPLRMQDLLFSLPSQ